MVLAALIVTIVSPPCMPQRFGPSDFSSNFWYLARSPRAYS
jgi:hypothetical protein